MVDRSCGCTGDVSPVPLLGEPVSMMVMGCEHGFDGWQSLADLCGTENMTLGAAVYQTVGALQDATSMADSEEWMPHRDLYLFAYRVQADGGTPWAGLHVVTPTDLRIVWDPCPMNLRVHHGSMDALEWAIRSRRQTDLVNEIAAVISWR